MTSKHGNILTLSLLFYFKAYYCEITVVLGRKILVQDNGNQPSVFINPIFAILLPTSSIFSVHQN